MGATTAIAWTDATVNFWWGCTKVGPGCDHCYAERWDARTGGAHWGVSVPRRKIKSAPDLIAKLDRQARSVMLSSGARRPLRIFIQSMSDLFDLEVPVEWFDEAWQCIHECDRLAIQIVTKRVTAIEKRLRAWSWPKHAGLIVTVVNQEEADRDVPRALALKAKLGIPWLGLSVEPQIGPIDLGCVTDRPEFAFPGVDWVISGGESKQGKGHEPRHYDLAWPRSLLAQCSAAGVAYFQKQLGARPVMTIQTRGCDVPWHGEFTDRQAGADPAEWPADLRVQQFPEALR